MKTDRWICTLVGTPQLELPNEFLSRKAGRESQTRENNLGIARSDGVKPRKALGGFDREFYFGEVPLEEREAALRDQRGSPFEAHHPDSPLQAGLGAGARHPCRAFLASARRAKPMRPSGADCKEWVVWGRPRASSLRDLQYEPLWSLISKAAFRRPYGTRGARLSLIASWRFAPGRAWRWRATSLSRFPRFRSARQAYAPFGRRLQGMGCMGSPASKLAPRPAIRAPLVPYKKAAFRRPYGTRGARTPDLLLRRQLLYPVEL